MLKKITTKKHVFPAFNIYNAMEVIMAIVVFYGGKSCEHDVSVITGVQALHLLDGEHAIAVYIDRNGKWLVPKTWQSVSQYRGEVKGRSAYVRSGEPWLYVGKGKRLAKIDVAVLCCHGAYGEDGCLQGILQSADVPYVGSGVAASAIGLDKRLSKRAFAGAGLRLLPYLEVERNEYENELRQLIKRASVLGYPLIVKPSSCGSSIGIRLARNAKQLITALGVAFQWDDYVVIEQALENFTEYNCGVIGAGNNLRASEVEKPAKLDEILTYADKYERGGLSGKGARAFPADISVELSTEIKEKAVAAATAIGASGIARVDFLFDEEEGKLYINEINTLPGSLALYLFDDKKAALDEIISVAKKAANARNSLSYKYESGIIRGKDGKA